jgi:drug/metabolite transporter (DMT)-like permease
MTQMWFALSLLALSMLVARRSAEKHVAGRVNSLAMAWLQQAAAIPFIVATLFFAKFYWPSELSAHFWTMMAVFVVLMSIDVYCYFKALSMADVSYIAPLMSLVAIGSIVGAYFILDQVPTLFGLLGAGMVVLGAILTYRGKKHRGVQKQANKVALLLIMVIVVLRGFSANIEVLMLRLSNPTTYNFYSSALTIPLILLASLAIIYTNRNGKYANYWTTVGASVVKHKWLLLFIGLTYTINMLATYEAKIIGPNAGYVTAVKSASVLPMMLVGALVFKEKIAKLQWYGLAIIACGLLLIGIN